MKLKQALTMGIALAALVALPAAGWAQGKPDFSGTWTLDQAKSDPAPAAVGRGGGGGARGAGGAGAAASMVPKLKITQTATEFNVDREVGIVHTNATYKLDGSESTNTMGDVFLSRSKAVWDAGTLVITTVKDLGPQPVGGTAAEGSKEVYSLAGGVLTITVTPQNTGARGAGGGPRKFVYAKGS